MSEYLKKYPEDEIDIMALVFSLGDNKANKICEKALLLGKKVSVENDETKLDKITYSFI